MTNIENIYVCIAAPLLIAMLCTDKKYRAAFCFCFAGMTMCLLSAYLNTFFCAFYGVDNMNATTQIAPVVEEVMKLLPLLFFMVIFEPKIEKFRLAAIITAVSFATFENICYLTGNGAEQIGFLLIRGFGAGAMHVVCGGAYSEGLLLVWENRMLRSVCLPGILFVAIVYHAIYNLLVSVGGTLQVIAYFIPVTTLLLVLFLKKNIFKSA